jgi:hypothetical protein
MSRTIKGSKPAGMDFWSKRGNSIGKILGTGHDVKFVTRRRERAEAKKACLTND